MRTIKKKQFFLIVLLVLTPWFNANYFDSIKPPSNTETNAFYEANPCKVSLFEFIYSNKDFSNFELVSDDYSSILCFGRVSQIKDNKIVSIGTNFLISSIFYVFFICFLIKNKKTIKILRLENSYIRISYLSLLFTLLIFSDRKFYVTNFYFLNPFKFRTYILLFIFLFLISILLIQVYLTKRHHIINLMPFLLLFSGTVSKSNFNIFLLLIVYLGMESISLNKNYLKYFSIYMFINFLWTLNARNTYILPENIYPGFSSTSYDFYSIFFYSIFFILFIFGAYKFVVDNINFFSYKIFMKNFTVVIFVKILMSIFVLKINFISFLTNFFNPQNTKNIIYYDFFNLFRIDERIIFLFIIIFFFKFVITRSIETVDYLPIVLIFFMGINFSSFIAVVENKINITRDFFDIYNPTFLEIILGSGPLNFNQIYVESTFPKILNQHLFSTSIILFFGLLGIVLFMNILFIYLKRYLWGIDRLFLGFVLSINFIFSDSLNYYPVFLFYILFFMLLKKRNLNSEICK